MKGVKMETIYSNLSKPDDFIIDGPTDKELKEIEENIEKYSN